jgi:hypothetical protein
VDHSLNSVANAPISSPETGLVAGDWSEHVGAVPVAGHPSVFPLLVFHGSPGLDHPWFGDYLDTLTAGAATVWCWPTSRDDVHRQTRVISASPEQQAPAGTLAMTRTVPGNPLVLQLEAGMRTLSILPGADQSAGI